MSSPMDHRTERTGSEELEPAMLALVESGRRPIALFFKTMFHTPQVRTTVVLLYVTLAITLWASIPRDEPLLQVVPTGAQVLVPQDFRPDMTCGERCLKLLTHAPKIWGTFLLFGLFPFLIAKGLGGRKMADYGVRFGNRATFWLTLVVLPPLFVGVWLSGMSTSFYRIYPLNPWALGGATTWAEGWGFFVLHSVMYALMYYGCWEFFYRGFLQTELTPVVGCCTAVLIQTMASTLVHIGHPLPEILGALVAGLLWGFCAYRTQSLLSGLLQHMLIGVVLDISLIWHAMG